MLQVRELLARLAGHAIGLDDSRIGEALDKIGGKLKARKVLGQPQDRVKCDRNTAITANFKPDGRAGEWVIGPKSDVDAQSG